MLMVIALTGAPAWAEVEPGLSMTEILARIDRNRRMSPESARMMISGLKGQSQPAMVLELILLESYGPEAVRDPASAHTRLQQLLADTRADADESFIVPLELLERELALRLELARDCRDLRAELAEERHAHTETRAKLEALRAIDEDMETRESENDSGGARSDD